MLSADYAILNQVLESCFMYTVTADWHCSHKTIGAQGGRREGWREGRGGWEGGRLRGSKGSRRKRVEAGRQ